MKHLKKQAEMDKLAASKFDKFKSLMQKFIELSKKDTEDFEKNVNDLFNKFETATDESDIDDIHKKTKSIIKSMEAESHSYERMISLFENDCEDCIDELREEFEKSWEMVAK